ncbi:alpha/beta hydrolase [Kibdelosporangium philippinense]|uniref:Alpha/beta hydrolase n=1 Tax=Kibdelosporangium philippinense TaxID=211113 RepID=A0ABS8ZQZ6_9PSEU|nr:alpha/beta hydrolase [Kibdelosporangium philippinense]MCE7010174.1 alpha/beta hydrolase [Kibdelosporangium philippinense]
MRSLTRSAVTVAAGVLLGSSLLTVPAAAYGGPAVPVIAWEGCGPEFPGFDCATVEVPLDYDKPRGATTKLAMARKTATDKNKRIGTLFMNPGGPGGSGKYFVLGAASSFAKLNERFDLLGFDPRGINESSPVRCFQTVAELRTFFTNEAIGKVPYEPEQKRPYVDHFRKLGPHCTSNAQTASKHVSTADVARDMDLLRQAVGDKKLSYLGLSYGTYIGNTYASLFGKNVRALVNDGTLDPQLWSSGWQIADDRTNSGRSFDEMLNVCDQAGPHCVFHSPDQTAKARWEKLADSIRAKPVVVDDELVDYDYLIGFGAYSTYGPGIWRPFLNFLVQVEKAASSGTPVTTNDPEIKALRQKQEEYNNGNEAYYVNQCADTEYPRHFAEYDAIGRWAEAGSRFGPSWWWSNAACADWPVNEDRFAGPWMTKTAAPALVVGNYFDGVTGYNGAKASSRYMQGSRLLTYAGWGHTAYGATDCVTDHIDNYLIEGKLPAEGTVCPAAPNPFLPTTQLNTKPAVSDLLMTLRK